MNVAHATLMIVKHIFGIKKHRIVSSTLPCTFSFNLCSRLCINPGKDNIARVRAVVCSDVGIASLTDP